MEGLNYEDISYKDRQLGTDITKALQEYDAIAQKITNTRQKLNKYSNINYPYQTPIRSNFNISYKSPYISLKRSDQRFIPNYSRNNFSKDNLLEEFKETLEKSRLIKDDLLRKSSHIKSLRNKSLCPI